MTFQEELLATQEIIDFLIDKGELTLLLTRLSQCFSYSGFRVRTKISFYT